MRRPLGLILLAVPTTVAAQSSCDGEPMRSTIKGAALGAGVMIGMIAIRDPDHRISASERLPYVWGDHRVQRSLRVSDERNRRAAVSTSACHCLARLTPSMPRLGGSWRCHGRRPWRIGRVHRGAGWRDVDDRACRIEWWSSVQSRSCDRDCDGRRCCGRRPDRCVARIPRV